MFMNEYAMARGAAPPHAGHLPRWCEECRDTDPPGAMLHRGPATDVAVYDEACRLVDAQVQAAYWDKASDWLGTDPADLERPHVEVTIADGTDVQLYLNPTRPAP